MSAKQKREILRRKDVVETDCSKREGKYSSEVDLLGRFYCWGLRNLISRIVGFLWVRRVEGLENVPDEGSFMIVPNHSSFVDFMIVIDALRKKKNICFFIKKKYFDMKIWNFFLKRMGHIRADNDSIKKSFALVAEGCPLVLFAEGTRTKNGSVGDAYPGLAVIAKRKGIVTVPMRIDGTYDFWPWNERFPKFSAGRCIDVKFYPSRRCSDFSSVGDFSDSVMGEIEHR